MDTLILIVLILAGIVHGQWKNTICLPQEHSNNKTEKCFIPFKTTKLSWINGQEYCNVNFTDGKLAEPLSEAEINATKNVIVVINKPAWLGARREPMTGQFKWEVSNQTFAYSKLQLSNSSTPEDCILAKIQDAKNNDCNSSNSFVCETGSRPAFVNIHTNQPVSVKLFIMDGREHGAEQDIFFATARVNTSGATDILFPMLPEVNDVNDTRGSGFNQWKEEINKKLIVDIKTTSAYRRSKESSPDTRMSAQVIGSVLGISFISSVVFFIVIGDAISLTKFCFTFLKNLIVTQNKVHNSNE